MKKMITLLLPVVMVMTVLLSCNEKSKDPDIKAATEKALKDDPSATNVTVDVKDGVVTLSGTCVNEKAKEGLTIRVETVPDVKSVVNSCTVLQETVMTDDELNTKLYDLTKDISTVNAIKIGALNGVVAIAGPVTKKEWEILKVSIDKLKPKGYDTTMLNLQ